MKTTRWMCKTTAVLLFLVLFEGRLFAEEEKTISVPVVSEAIISQRIYQQSTNACAPSSLLNALKFGDDDLQKAYRDLLGQNDLTKLSFVIDRYLRNRPSVVAKGQKRWGFHGVFVADFAQSCKDLLSEAELPICEGAFLDRKENETDSDHLRRIHKWMKNSFNNGFPPILSLRSFSVKTRDSNDNKPFWEVSHHHFVMIQSIPENLPKKALGFEAEVIDPNGGRLTTITIRPEPNRQPFAALKGNEVEGEWLRGRPFLLATAPEVNSLRPANLEWSERFIITVNYLVGRF